MGRKMSMVIAAVILAAALAGCADSETEAPTSPAAQKVVYADEIVYTDEEVPAPGTCLIGYQLQEALNDPVNDGALFFVFLQPYCFEDVYESQIAAFRYGDRTVDEWQAIANEYISGLNAFMEERMAAAAPDETLDKYALFVEWAEMHGQDPTAESDAASRERRNMLIGLEADRLESCGINVVIESPYGADDMYARLTKEQAMDFPCGDCGYGLLLAQKTSDGMETEPSDE